MARSLGTTALRMNLAVTTYVLTLAVFIPVSGWFADRFGARRIFVLALIVFTTGSVLCGMANSFAMLILTRGLQGLGGAMMTPVGRLILLRSFPTRPALHGDDLYERAGAHRPRHRPACSAGSSPPMSPGAGSSISTSPSAASASCWPCASSRRSAARNPPRFDFRGFLMVGAGLALLQYRDREHGPADHPAACDRGRPDRRCPVPSGFPAPCAQGGGARGRPHLVSPAQLSHRDARRRLVPHRDERRALPAAAHAAGRPRDDSARLRLAHLLQQFRGASHPADLDPAAARFGVRPRAVLERCPGFGLGRGLCPDPAGHLTLAHRRLYHPVRADPLASST